MTRIFCSIVLVFAAFLHANARVQLGDNVDTLLAKLGEPTGLMERGGVTFYSYPQGVVQVKDGVVSHVSDGFEPGRNVMTRRTADGEVVEYQGSRDVSAEVATERAQPVSDVVGWMTDFGKARELAKQVRRPMLLYFTGSDWCGWCQRLKQEVLSTDTFLSYAQQDLVLVELDFPRRIILNDQLIQQNNQLRSKWNVEGFPTVLLVDGNDKLLGKTGYTGVSPEAYVAHLEEMLALARKQAAEAAAAVAPAPSTPQTGGGENGLGGLSLRAWIQILMVMILLFIVLKKVLKW